MRLSTLDTAAATPGRARKPRPGERWPGSRTYMRIAEDLRSDLARSIANVVAHEFVHMTGVHVHDSSGLRMGPSGRLVTEGRSQLIGIPTTSAAQVDHDRPSKPRSSCTSLSTRSTPSSRSGRR